MNSIVTTASNVFTLIIGVAFLTVASVGIVAPVQAKPVVTAAR